MGFRAVWLIPAAAAVAALGVACGADDPDAITVDPGHGPSRTGPGFDGSIPDTGSTPPPSKETGGESSAEGGIEDATIPIDAPKDTGESKDVAMLEDSTAAAVFGSTVYAGMLPATTAAMNESACENPTAIPPNRM